MYTNTNCYFHDKNYLVTNDQSWISFFKADNKSKISLYDDKNYNGNRQEIIAINGICRKLPKDFWNKASSVNINSQCIVLFSRDNCTSSVHPIRLSNFENSIDDSNFEVVSFNDEARSYASCQGYKFINKDSSLESNQDGKVYWGVTNENDNQVWELEPLPNGIFKFRNRATQKYLKANNTFFTDTYTLENDQEWFVESYRITNKENKFQINFQKIDIFFQTLSTTTQTTLKTTKITSCTNESDNGVRDRRCGFGLYACLDSDGFNKGCYSKTQYTCFRGGFLCSKPFCSCNFACYDVNLYKCIDGVLIDNFF